jgi:hypothetical protein
VAILKFRAWVFLALCAGCGLPLRPDGSPVEERCPAGAREAMESLGLHPGSVGSVDLDVSRRERDPLILYDGPIESETWTSVADFPGQTRLYGRVWTSGPWVVIRYYSARLPDGKVIPVCAVAAEGRGPGIPKSPGRSGSAAVEHSSAAFFIVGQFR